MKQIKALACSNSQEILGRVTLNGKNIFNRSAYILVTNAKDTPKGYKAIISTHDSSDKPSAQYIQVDDISDFNEGDVINITKDGENVFFMKSALHPMPSLQQLVVIIVVLCVLNLLCRRKKTGQILI